jgi:hypothetical protein
VKNSRPRLAHDLDLIPTVSRWQAVVWLQIRKPADRPAASGWCRVQACHGCSVAVISPGSVQRGRQPCSVATQKERTA